MIPPVTIPIFSRVNISFNSKIILLSAFGFNVLSGENSKPWLKTWVLLTLPISSVSTVNTTFLPSLVPIDVIIGKSVTLKPLFNTFTECTPPISSVDFVE